MRLYTTCLALSLTWLISSHALAIPIVSVGTEPENVLSIWGFQLPDGTSLDVVFRRGHSFSETFGDPSSPDFMAPYSLLPGAPDPQQLADAIAASGDFTSFNDHSVFAIPRLLRLDDPSAAVSWKDYIDNGDHALEVGSYGTNLNNPIRGNNQRAWADIREFSTDPPDDPSVVPEPASTLVWLTLIACVTGFRISRRVGSRNQA